MKTISVSKVRIAAIMEKADLGPVDLDDLDGYKIEQNSDGAKFVSSPAPNGEPEHYNSCTNTGGRRFICWA
jgi:hypothetical protein